MKGTFKSLPVSAAENFKCLIVVCRRVTNILWEFDASTFKLETLLLIY